MWQKINNDNDVRRFMSKMYYFHDSCLKELKYLSGAYVNENSMHAINDCRILSLIIQRGFDDYPMVELEFSGLKSLKLFPVDEKYTCEILDSTMFIKDGYVYWCDHTIYPGTELDNSTGVLVCAKSFRWRPIENHMGSEEYYRGGQGGGLREP